MVKRDVRLAGVVQGPEEIDAVIRVMTTDPPWHVSGPECNSLQKELAEFIGVKYCIVVNSGSSANLLALAALNLGKKSRILTSACGFPATLNPIIHLGHYPVLVDYKLDTLNIDLDQVELALQKYAPKAIIIAHTLGAPVDMHHLMILCDKYEVELIEDACEAIGSEYEGEKLGSFGEVSTVSFYSSHQISGFGGGGAVLTDNEKIYERAKSLRDWGKKSVREGYICTKMDTMVGDIPYDQQYTYDTIGYNMRYPDVNCAYAREQLKRLPGFSKKRYDNYMYLQKRLQSFNVPLHYPEWPDFSNPACFGFPVVLKEEGQRDRLVEHLENNGVHVRLFFAGNILRHKAYENLKYSSLCTNFPIADYLMRNAFFCGVWPGLMFEDMEYIANTIESFFTKN